MYNEESSWIELLLKHNNQNTPVSNLGPLKGAEIHTQFISTGMSLISDTIMFE